MNWSVGAKIGGGFALAVVAMVALGVTAFVTTRKLVQTDRSVGHGHLVIEKLEQVLSVLTEAETATRGYVITADEKYLDPYKAAPDNVRSGLDALRMLTAEAPDQQVQPEQAGGAVRRKIRRDEAVDRLAEGRVGAELP